MKDLHTFLSSLFIILENIRENLNLDNIEMTQSKSIQVAITVSIVLTSTAIIYYYLPDIIPSTSNYKKKETAAVASAVIDKSTADKLHIRKQRYRHTVEICLSGIESVRNAIQSGANSVELCSDIAQGGITPSLGLVSEAVRMCRGIDVEVHCLIRPRPGLFTYSDAEFDCMLRDILAVKNIGASGVVVGILHSDGTIDSKRMQILRNISSGLKLTFHRAFDVCTESISVAVDALVDLQCDRILTSGRSSSAIAGIESMKQIVNCANKRLEVVAAAGVSKDNARRLLHEAGVSGVHAGSSVLSTIEESYITSGTTGHGEDITSKTSTGHSRVDSTPSVKMGLTNVHGSIKITNSECYQVVDRKKVQSLVAEASAD